METSEIYSNIPMRTWRWLGVNEVPEPENVAGQLQQTALQVDAGKQDEVVYVNRGGGAQDLTIDIKGREVLVIEDIVDSGRTLSYLMHMLKKREPASLEVCTLLDKPSCRETDVQISYCGFDIEDHFIVGFGLDYAQRYRNLPYIGVLNLKED